MDANSSCQLKLLKTIKLIEASNKFF